MLSRLIDSLSLGDPPKLTGNPAEDVKVLAKNLADTKTAILAFLRSLNRPDVLTIDQAEIDGSAVGGTTPAAGDFTTLSASGLVSADGGQIKFPATQNASADANTLDDYEEGSFTPNLVFATPGDLLTAFSTRGGDYLKVGNRVFATVLLETNTFAHTTAAGALQITDLPFTSANAGGFRWVGPLRWSGITQAGYSAMALSLGNNTTTANVIASGSGVAESFVTAADMPTGGTVVLFGTLSYRV
jgi:hypothetical protein